MAEMIPILPVSTCAQSRARATIYVRDTIYGRLSVLLCLIRRYDRLTVLNEKFKTMTPPLVGRREFKW